MKIEDFDKAKTLQERIKSIDEAGNIEGLLMRRHLNDAEKKLLDDITNQVKDFYEEEKYRLKKEFSEL